MNEPLADWEIDLLNQGETMAEFKAGDTVKAYGKDWTVTYGPFHNAYEENGWYVIKDESGYERYYEGALMTPAPAFKVGDEVKVPGDSGTIKAGPFVGDEGPWWVVSHRAVDGVMDESRMTKVADSNTYTHDGITYDLSAEYLDSEDDVWTFTGELDEEGAPEVNCDMSGYTELASAVETYGPFTKI